MNRRFPSGLVLSILMKAPVDIYFTLRQDEEPCIASGATPVLPIG